MGAGHDGHLRPFLTKATVAPSARIVLVVMMLSTEEGPGDQEGPERAEPDDSSRPTHVVDFRDAPAQESSVVRSLLLFCDIFCLALSSPRREDRMRSRREPASSSDSIAPFRSSVWSTVTGTVSLTPSRAVNTAERAGGKAEVGRPCVFCAGGPHAHSIPQPPRHAPSWISRRRMLRELPRPAPVEGRASR
jgi:hypothetical protein